MIGICPICGAQNSLTGHICWKPNAAILTDNTAVIRALEQRVAELEKVAEEAVKFSVTTGRMSAGLKSALKAAGYLGVGDE